jgi:hypothetical protein
MTTKDSLMVLSTRQVGQRIRHGLPAYSPGGMVRCACHPNLANPSQTESLRFWVKDSMVGCTKTRKWAPALAVFPKLGIIIDTRL